MTVTISAGSDFAPVTVVNAATTTTTMMQQLDEDDAAVQQLGPPAGDMRDGVDKWHLGATYNNTTGVLVGVDVYPRFNVSIAQLTQEANTLVWLSRDLLTLLRNLGFAATDGVLFDFGMSTHNPTIGRTSPEQPITDGATLSILGPLAHATLTTTIREFLVDNGYNLPKYGTGLSMLYGALEYRIERRAVFEHKDDVLNAVALLRSLDKVACADWTEQNEDTVHKRARLVRNALE